MSINLDVSKLKSHGAPKGLVFALLVLTLTFLARAFLLANDRRPIFDSTMWRIWAQRLRDNGISGFYTNNLTVPHPSAGFAPFQEHLQNNPDHFPTNIYFLWLAEKLHHLGGHDVLDRSFDLTYISIILLLEALSCYLIYKIVLQLGLPKAYRSIYWLAIPPVYITSCHFGSWDSAALAFVLLGTYLLLRGDKLGLVLAPLAWAIALQSKPYVALLILPLAFVVFLSHKKGPWKALGAVAILGFLGSAAWAAPFKIGVLWDPGNGSLLDRISYSNSLWPDITHGATSVWMLSSTPDEWIEDYSVLGFSVMTVALTMGTAIFATWALCARRAFQNKVEPMALILWTAFILSFGWYLVFPRMVPHYTLMAILMLFMLGFYQRQYFAFLVAIATTSIINSLDFLPSGKINLISMQTLTVVNLVVFCGVLLTFARSGPRRDLSIPVQAQSSVK